MASLILVLREGAIKQALDHARRRRRHRPADRSTRSPRSLNERLVDMTGQPRRGAHRRARPATTGSTPSPGGSASGSSGSSANTTPRRSRRSSATACSTSWRRPSSPRATSSAGSSTPSRTGPTSASSSAASPAPGTVQVFIGHENQPLEMRDVSLVLAPYGRPGSGDRRRRRPRADPDVLFPGDRHGPLRVRPHERTGGSPVCLNSTHARAPRSARTRSTSRRPPCWPRSRP